MGRGGLCTDWFSRPSPLQGAVHPMHRTSKAMSHRRRRRRQRRQRRQRRRRRMPRLVPSPPPCTAYPSHDWLRFASFRAFCYRSRSATARAARGDGDVPIALCSLCRPWSHISFGVPACVSSHRTGHDALEEIRAHGSLAAVPLQTANAPVGGFLAWVEVLAMRFAARGLGPPCQPRIRASRGRAEAYLSKRFALGPDHWPASDGEVGCLSLMAVGSVQGRNVQAEPAVGADRNR